MSFYNIVASTNESTVVSEYTPKTKHSDAYQSEEALEKEFIKLLQEQSYDYLTIKSESELIANLRVQLEILNNYKFSDNEWKNFFDNNIANSNFGIVEKTRIIQEDYVQNLKRDDGSTKNIKLIDKERIYNNRLQVINQYVNNDGNYDNRYDVTILINGLPLVHCELKRRGVAIKEAFNQINRYQRDSFWAQCGLYEYVQIFIISNGTHTKYYSNTTRESHIKERSQTNKAKSKRTSNSFEFTSYWADANNKIIPDLVDFTKTFLAKSTLLNILTKYCVFTSEKMLLVMRPYQIAATERILNRIEISTNYKTMGTLAAGGYIWHTTGSGKTLTSFKTAQLASKLSYIDKVLFVVDRKDLDYQTMKEYDRFEKGAANGNTSTAVLQRQLEDKDKKGTPHHYPIIVTTIQKLDNFISKNSTHPVYDKHVVIIFDECHRSQFGDMHKKIAGIEGQKKNKGAFKNYHIFGFTGTPIFAENAGAGKSYGLKTTAQAFGDKLHTYTIVNAIDDGNVLPFRIDYIPTMDEKDEITDSQVKGIDTNKAYLEPKRIRLVTSYILEHFNRKTKRNQGTYIFNQLKNIKEIASAKLDKKIEEIKEQTRLSGFNSIFAVSSIEAAKLYYTEFKKQMKQHPEQKIKIATIYSYSVNEDEVDGILSEENPDDTSGLDKSSRDFLEDAIKDYNQMFDSAYDTSSDKFPNYYKDVSLRMKNREIDMLIVVNMFLTGFDATTLNTLWVDKNLKQHGLLQAFSRTNRILNSVKSFGNIVCFRRPLQKATDDAIALFGDKEAGGIVLLKNFDDYYNGYEDEKGYHKGYTQLIDELNTKYPLGEKIIGETNEINFIRLFGNILRIRNILSCFDEFENNDLISLRDLQDYQGIYLDLRDEILSKAGNDKENINEDIVFEIGLIKQIEINIDYILMLVAKYHKGHCKDKEILGTIDKAIGSSTQLRSKKQLIEDFIGTLDDDSKIYEDWQTFVLAQKEKELDIIIEEENLNKEATKTFIDNSFRDGILKTTGTDVDKTMPKMSRFGGGNRTEKKQFIIQKLLTFFDKFFGLFN